MSRPPTALSKPRIDAVRVFGKTDAEIDQMIASRKTDPALVVRSPIAGKITAYNAPPGLLVQPGNPPAPYTVAVLSVKWMLADVMESDIALLQLGQPVQVKVMAYPKRVFKGKISKIYPMVDPNTHRETVRSEIEDPKDELRPGMLANFIIRVEGPAAGIAIPANGVVREPDGTMTAWVTTDRRHFEQRVIKTGMRKDDRVQILNGLRRGELVVTDGAVFLSSMLSAPRTSKDHHVQISSCILFKPPRDCRRGISAVCRRRDRRVQAAQHRGLSESDPGDSGNHRAGGGSVRRGDGALLHASHGDRPLLYSRH